MIPVAILQTLLSATDGAIVDIGWRITFVGMATVFSGLVILSLSLPLIRRLAEGKTKKETVRKAASGNTELSREEIVAITAAVHAHVSKINRLADMQLTWEMYERPYSPWRLAGRAKIVADRAAFGQRNRSR